MMSVYGLMGKEWLCTVCQYQSKFKNNVRKHIKVHHSKFNDWQFPKFDALLWILMFQFVVWVVEKTRFKISGDMNWFRLHRGPCKQDVQKWFRLALRRLRLQQQAKAQRERARRVSPLAVLPLICVSILRQGLSKSKESSKSCLSLSSICV